MIKFGLRGIAMQYVDADHVNQMSAHPAGYFLAGQVAGFQRPCNGQADPVGQRGRARSAVGYFVPGGLRGQGKMGRQNGHQIIQGQICRQVSHVR